MADPGQETCHCDKPHIISTCHDYCDGKACEFRYGPCQFGHDPPGENVRMIKAREHEKHHAGWAEKQRMLSISKKRELYLDDTEREGKRGRRA